MYWTVSVEGDHARVYHASVAVGNSIYTFGGRYCGDKRSDDNMEVHILDAETLHSVVVPVRGDVTPPNLLGHSAVVHGSLIYVWGGYSASPFRSDDRHVLWCFDTATQTWSHPETTGSVPTPRIYHTACVVSGCMLVIGGFDRRFGFPMRTVEQLDLTSLTWSSFPTTDNSPPGGVYRSAILTKAQDGFAPVDDVIQICIFVGATDRSLFPRGNVQNSIDLCVQESMKLLYGWKVAFLDPKSGTWIFGSSPAVPSFSGSTGFVHRNYLYMTQNKISKGDGKGWLSRRCIESLSLEEILPLGACRTSRHLGSCVTVGDRVFFIGGATSLKENCGELQSNCICSNKKYKTLENHYGAVQVLDFHPNLQTMSAAIIAQYNLDTSQLPLALQKEVELFTPRHRWCIH